MTDIEGKFLTYPGAKLEKNEKHEDFSVTINGLPGTRKVYILKGKKKYALDDKCFDMWYWRDDNSIDGYRSDNDFYRIIFDELYIRIEDLTLDETKQYIANTSENCLLIYEKITSNLSNYLYDYYRQPEHKQEAIYASTMSPFHYFPKVGHYLLDLQKQIYDINKTWIKDGTFKADQPFCLECHGPTLSYIPNKSFWLVQKFYDKKNLLFVTPTSFFAKREFKYLKKHFSKCLDTSNNITGRFAKRLKKLAASRPNEFLFFIFDLDEQYAMKKLLNLEHETVLI